MKIITFADINNLQIKPSKCLEWAETMIKQKNQAILPPKISLKPCDGVFCNVMPSMIGIVGERQKMIWGGKSCYSISGQTACTRQ